MIYVALLLLVAQLGYITRRPYQSCDPTEPEGSWSIGIFYGKSPFELEEFPGNPVLECDEITEVPATFVADPFLISTGPSSFFLFFEVKNGATGIGEIGLATSRDGVFWRYEGPVLRLPDHVSYPYVFQEENEYFMIPETSSFEEVRLYRAVGFPHDWQLDTVLLSGGPEADCSPLHYQAYWYLFCGARGARGKLLLYVSSDLRGPYLLHNSSLHRAPDTVHSRPAGRFFHYLGQLYRPVQESGAGYGLAVRAMEITHLSPTSLLEIPVRQPNPLLQTPHKHRWNSARMHHIDLLAKPDGTYLAAVDGDSVVRG
jgi:hypothetical protein